MENPLRALVVDDTAIYRSIMTRTLSGVAGVELVGTARNGQDALEQVRQYSPDVVFLDIEMPVMDGLEALSVLGRDHPEVAVLMVSSVTDAGRTMKALGLGALDFISKPEATGDAAAELRSQLEKGLRIVRSHRRKRSAPRSPAPAPPRPRRESPLPRLGAQPGAGLVAIGVSTGGPKALHQILSSVQGEITCPVLIVQHMPKGFTASLAQSLNRSSALEVMEAKEGDTASAGRVLIAAGGRHMELVKPEQSGLSYVVRLHDGPPVNECRPSVDLLFESVAERFPGPILSIVLTGMGSDGCEGMRRLKERGAHCIAQDEESCVVYGMPRSVVDAGLTHEVLPLEAISLRIQAFASDAPRVAG